MKLSSIMTKQVVTVDMDTSLKAICGIFDDKKFHHLLVVEDNELCGVISDRDLLKASSPFLNTLAEQKRDVERRPEAVRGNRRSGSSASISRTV